MTPSELISELRSLGQQDETVLFQFLADHIYVAKIPYALASYIACSFLPKVGKCA
jgi:hypothetical protein